jgi:two-component system cell cycle response regulator
MGSDTAPERKRVLLSDDNADLGYALKLYVEAEGHEVRHTISAEETLDWARSWQPHVVVTDGYKPGQVDGLPMTRRLKACDETKHIPVIIVSPSCDKDEYRREALDAGACAVLAKPLDPKDFLRLIEEAVGPGRP